MIPTHRTSDTLRLSTLDRVQPLLLIASIGLGLGLAKIAGGFAAALLPMVSVGVFALIYLVMLGVDVRGVGAAFAKRRFLGAAVVINFVVNPLMAWGLAALFLRGQPELWVGLILFLVTPCIGWYLVFTELAGGNASLGVSVLAINVVLQILLLPLYVYLFAGEAIGVDVATVVDSVALFLVLPLLLGAATRGAIRRSGRTVESIQAMLRLSLLKTAMLMVVIAAMFASQAQVIFDNPGVFATLVPPVVAFFLVAFAVALVVGRILRLPHDEVVLLVFTTTSRNSEASLAIAATAFASPLVPLAVVIGPVIELPLLVLMVRLLLQLPVRALKPQLT